MGISRSSFYDAPRVELDDTALVEAMAAICDEFGAYGWRRVHAALRQQGLVVNHKKVRRLLREHDLQPRRRRRHIATTDSDHDGPVLPDLARGAVTDGPDQLWVADLTYVAITGGFAYVAVILDAWSRRVVGYAIGRSIDARLTLAALRAALAARRPAAPTAARAGATVRTTCSTPRPRHAPSSRATRLLSRNPAPALSR